MRKQWLLYIAIYIISCAAYGLEALPANDASHSDEARITLEGGNSLIIPQVGLMQPDRQWTYPFGSYPIIAEGSNISAAFAGGQQLSGTRVSLLVSSFSISDFSSPQMALSQSASPGQEAAISLDRTGDGAFVLPGLPAGLFSLFALDRANRTVLAALPVLVTSGQLQLEMDGNVTAGDIIGLRVRDQPGNESRIYGAVMVSLKDYRNASLKTATDGQNITTNITLGQNSMQIQGVPGFSRDFLLSLFSLLPGNSAVAMVESNQSEATFNLISDREWEKGSYIITAAVYSQGRVSGIKQEIVEVL